MQRALLPAALAVLFMLSASPGLGQDGAAPRDAGLRPSLGLGVLGGGHFFAEGTNLGVASAPAASAGARHNALVGVRTTLGLGHWAAVEAEAFAMITPDRTYDVRATLLGYRLQALAYLAAGDLRPFVLLGAGVLEVVATHAEGPAGLVRDRDGEFHVGGGLDYRMLERLSARADLRVVEMPGKQLWSLAPDIEATLALAVIFGAGPRASAPAGADADVGRPAPVVAAPAAPAVAPPPTTRPPPAPVVPIEVAPALPAAASRSLATPAAAPLPTPEPGTDAVAPAAPSGPKVKELLGRGREIQFEGATARLSVVSLPLLGQLAEALVREPGSELEILSHTAASGNPRKDLAVSRRRAEAVKRALVEREVDAGRLTATGRGSEAPLAPNITRSGRRLNERMELRLVVPGGR